MDGTKVVDSPFRPADAPKQHGVALVLGQPQHLVRDGRAVLVDAATPGHLPVVGKLDLPLRLRLHDVQDPDRLRHDLRANVVAGHDEDTECLRSRVGEDGRRHVVCCGEGMST